MLGYVSPVKKAITKVRWSADRCSRVQNNAATAKFHWHISDTSRSCFVPRRFEAAKAEAEAFADKAIERAVVDAEAITKLMMPKDVEENARLESEVRALEAEVLRQGRIIRILSKVLKAVLPESYLSKVRRAFHFESEKVDPSDICASASVLDDQSP